MHFSEYQNVCCVLHTSCFLGCIWVEVKSDLWSLWQKAVCGFLSPRVGRAGKVGPSVLSDWLKNFPTTPTYSKACPLQAPFILFPPAFTAFHKPEVQIWVCLVRVGDSSASIKQLPVRQVWKKNRRIMLTTCTYHDRDEGGAWPFDLLEESRSCCGGVQPNFALQWQINH